jgi:endonuclease/exonuclease/phosphatase family metal-dependent hydrolase
MKFKFRFIGINPKFFLFLFVMTFSLIACSQSIDQEPENDLIIVTYNLRYNNSGDGENAWGNRKEQVKALIRFHEFEIFGTQEGLIDQLNDLATMKEYSFIGVGRDDGKTEGEHSAIFYRNARFEVLDKGDFWLSETPEKPSYGWDAKIRRICSWGKFRDKTDNKIFFVFNAHFDHRGVEARRQSGILMVKKIKEIAGNNTAFFLGDLNSTPDTEQIETLSSFLNDSYKVSQMPPYGPVGTSNGFNFNAPLQRRIDYIFVSDNIKVLKYGGLSDSYEQKYPSDHLPVMIKALIE